jgi:hypothetical protein
MSCRIKSVVVEGQDVRGARPSSAASRSQAERNAVERVLKAVKIVDG